MFTAVSPVPATRPNTDCLVTWLIESTSQNFSCLSIICLLQQVGRQVDFNFLWVFIGIWLLYNVVLVSAVKWISRMFTFTPVFGFPSHYVTTEQGIDFSKLYSRFSLVIYVRHSISSVYTSTSTSQLTLLRIGTFKEMWLLKRSSL